LVRLSVMVSVFSGMEIIPPYPRALSEAMKNQHSRA